MSEITRARLTRAPFDRAGVWIAAVLVTLCLGQWTAWTVFRVDTAVPSGVEQHACDAAGDAYHQAAMTPLTEIPDLGDAPPDVIKQAREQRLAQFTARHAALVEYATACGVGTAGG